jgi:hypothetical protein
MTHRVLVQTEDNDYEATIHNERVTGAYDRQQERDVEWDELPFLVQQRLLAYLNGVVDLEVIR